MTDTTTEPLTPTGTETGTRRRATFNTLEVAQVRRLTDNAVEVSFAVPAELADCYNYLPGQYVALRATIDGKDVRRSYSLCSEPIRGEIRVGIKKDLGGVFSTWANETLQPGDRLEVMNPQGTFISRHALSSLNDAETLAGEQVEADPGLHLAAIAAGSGITPVLAITRAVLAGSDHTSVELVYANKAAQDVMFVEEIGDLKDRYPARFAVHHVLSREQRVNPLMSGRIDADKLQQILDNVIGTARIDEWFLCGPFELVQLCRDTLHAYDVADEDVRFELFSTGRPEQQQGDHGRPVVADPLGDNVTIRVRLDGTSTEIESPKHARETVLNAALRARPDVPFACAGGVCGTCRAKVTEGDFVMDENYALEKDEIERGYVLTCQTHPTGDRLCVDFDA
ncbi:1,2-phenylacetyl-CoA epoxidase subunit PaaE [Raineyella sp.]|uniref:1,2-phenylacetyl-CoA epoxidase, subunit E n=1 Tax=bioreactor metagenome TaxID=1076179 RepID=A0A644XTZ2_9ZZZZ|nr:1,2-phenylacetyl-CoA epoxidase subunit PaaE [Raineyella sp.]MEA5153671.1 1,2-phenylacetyl-CoA epoxidase subunit PaaE [Raineyella sp.]